MSNITDSELEKLAEDWLYSLEETNPQVLEKKYPLIPMKFGFKEGYKAALQNKVSDVSAEEKEIELRASFEKILPMGMPSLLEKCVKTSQEYASIVNEKDNIGVNDAVEIIQRLVNSFQGFPFPANYVQEKALKKAKKYLRSQPQQKEVEEDVCPECGCKECCCM